MSTLQSFLHGNRLSRLTESDWATSPTPKPTPAPVQPKPHWIKPQELADQLACFAMILDISKRQPEQDAKRTILAAIESITLLWWRVETRRPNVSPMPCNCPKKLYDHGCIRLAELHDLQVAFKPAATATHLFQVADTCCKTMELQFRDLLSGGAAQ